MNPLRSQQANPWHPRRTERKSALRGVLSVVAMFTMVVVLMGTWPATQAVPREVSTVRPGQRVRPVAPPASIPAKGIVALVPASAPSSARISEAVGSFDSVSPIPGISASGPLGNTGTPRDDVYTLQLNTAPYPSTLCSTPCMGWQQFIFDNDPGSSYLYIQYWLLDHAATCPSGWDRFTQSGAVVREHCVKNVDPPNVPTKVAIPSQAVASAARLRLTASAGAGSNKVRLEHLDLTPPLLGEFSGGDFGLATHWRGAEFNILGNGGNAAGGSNLQFSAGAELVARTRITYGGTDGTDCYAHGYSVETNSLGFDTTPAASGPGPAMVFKQSAAAAGAPADCAKARSVGDTHLATFNGVFYDFQAAGDFILAQTGSLFAVQTRQVSGKPTWPDASVNHAVAARLAKTRVALCLVPAGDRLREQLFIDGKRIELESGRSLEREDHSRIQRRDNVYTFVAPTGDSVRAAVHDTWINVSVGMGRWPAKVQGLLGDAEGRSATLLGRDGSPLAAPFTFADLYGRFGQSWQVRAEESLLGDCGARDTAYAPPSKLLFARDLTPEQRNKGMAACNAAGVKAGPLFEACVLDVVVLNRDAAAAVFATMPAPTVELVPTQGRDPWWYWLLIIVLIAALLWWLRRRGP
jgi:hypothetical protein